ncbi:helix-turn-helix transcriptional regulator [Roseovarius sp.]|jgi:prophage regulatory protein
MHSDTTARILTEMQVKERVPYSSSHLRRMERAGRFPKRVRLGPCRVGWVEAEVQDWLAARLADREGQ